MSRITGPNWATARARSQSGGLASAAAETVAPRRPDEAHLAPAGGAQRIVAAERPATVEAQGRYHEIGGGTAQLAQAIERRGDTSGHAVS